MTFVGVLRVFGQFSAAERTSWWGGILAHGHGVRLGGAEITPVEPDLVRTGEGMSEMTTSDAVSYTHLTLPTNREV